MSTQIMSLRLFFLAIGCKKTSDPYERGAVRAVRRYLISLIYPMIFGLSVLPIFGFVFLGGASFGVNMLWVCLVFLFGLNAFVALLMFVSAQIRTKITMPSFTLHPATRFMLRMSKLHGTPKTFVYVHEDEKDEQTNTAVILDFGWWRVVTTKLGMQNSRFARCMLGHELGHVVLPLGYFWFFQCRILLSPVDAVVDLTGRTLVRRYFRHHKSSAPDNTNGAWDDGTRFTRVLRVIHRFAWRCSSYAISHRREYACDAIAVLFLRDAFPLIQLLQIWVAREGHLFPPVYFTHPSHGQRINALLILIGEFAPLHAHYS